MTCFEHKSHRVLLVGEEKKANTLRIHTYLSSPGAVQGWDGGRKFSEVVRPAHEHIS